MGRLPILSLVLAAACLAAWAWIATRRAEAPAPVLPPRTPERVATPRPVDAQVLHAPDAPRVTARDSARDAAVATSADEGPRCVVIGRVVDLDGGPIADATVRLSARRTWAEGVDVPRLPGRYDLRGFEVRTDAAGAFRIEAPLPSAERTVLRVTPGRFHELLELTFGASGPGTATRPALLAGERDLGELRVGARGALVGRLRDLEGRPVVDAELRIETSEGRSLGGLAYSDADGRYDLAHAPEGRYGLGVKAEGFLLHHEPDLEVRAGQDTAVADIVLRTAPSLEGRVVDEQGKALEGAQLWGWPASAGAGAGARSGADGRFVVHLPQDEPYSLSAKLQGFHTWGEEFTRTTLYAPGTRDLEVVMRTLEATRFVVLDGTSGAPLRRFGLEVLGDNGSRSPRMVSTERRPPPLRDHPDGSASATAREGIDLVLVFAEGFLLAELDVEHDTPGVAVQTVHLRPGAGLRGRILRDGLPLAGVQVEVVELRPSSWIGGAKEPTGPVPVPNTERRTLTDGAGRFLLRGLAPRDQRLTARPASGAPLVLGPLRPPSESTLELGDLALPRGATLTGELRLPTGVEPAGLPIRLGTGRDSLLTLADSSGQFRFEHLSPGVHSVAHDARPGILAAGHPERVELADGETRHVTLDARDRTLCSVALRIHLDGLSPASLQVDLVHETDSTRRASLGRTDESGFVRGSAPALGPARVEIWSGALRALHPHARLDLRPFAELEAEVRFEFATLVLHLPPTPLPNFGALEVRLVPQEPHTDPHTLILSIVLGELRNSGPHRTALDGRAHLAALAPGRYRLDVTIHTSLPGLETNSPKETLHRSTHPIELLPGETLEVRLP